MPADWDVADPKLIAFRSQFEGINSLDEIARQDVRRSFAFEDLVQVEQLALRRGLKLLALLVVSCARPLGPGVVLGGHLLYTFGLYGGQVPRLAAVL